ncbi:MAG: hypothetical protein AVDCRST_MAG13-1700 [uncultured Solirubrobacteraceae bacterium]|uniref:HTH merR-type domain-containing protein n=1 Tax=uncultured Solirubrobacteraceae bacterium TaxID=1162706 RepID=A0A6J4SC25_9ACTN|nr:MAG: hypothetical protein AVDCRST_MAG13-1700 [uncultured Solirubrobacteraceae bacterium]
MPARPTRPDSLATGRSAQPTRSSAKQLRRHDELGLLAPAVVDPASGYRFSHTRQARTAATIAQLRKLNVPLGVGVGVGVLPACVQRPMWLSARTRVGCRDDGR